jgi:hypothetical protein
MQEARPMGATSSHRWVGWLLVVAGAIAATACSHSLKVKNLHLYEAPMRFGEVAEVPPDVAVRPFSGAHEDLFYFNALVERLSMDPGIGTLRTDFVGTRRGISGYDPDLVLSIQTQCEYRSSGWNFLINFPGFILFAPAWNGYVYRADVATDVAIHDVDGNALQQAHVPVSYNIREGDADRVTMAQLSWLEFGVLAFIGGIYNANTFDRDIIPELQVRVRDNYANYVVTQIEPQLRAAAAAVMEPRRRLELEMEPEQPPPDETPDDTRPPL